MIQDLSVAGGDEAKGGIQPKSAEDMNGFVMRAVNVLYIHD